MSEPNRARAGCTTALLAASALAAVALATDRPLWGAAASGGRAARAAVAVRDDVSAFEKLGTRFFAAPLLRDGYGHVGYVTLGGPDLAPYREALRAALRAAPEVDLFVLTHGSRRFLEVVDELNPKLRARLRLVYHSGCGSAAEAEAWLRTGARAFVGHGDRSVSPVFLFYFLRRWIRGARLEDAVEAANRRTAPRVRLGAGLWGRSAVEVARDSQGVLHGTGELTVRGKGSDR